MFRFKRSFFKATTGIISIGSEGAFGVIMQGPKIVDSFFVKDAVGLQNCSILLQHSNTPLKIVFDRDEIVFERYTIPPLGPKDMKQFISNKLAELRETNLKVGAWFNTEKAGSELTSPVTASLAQSAEIDTWLQALELLPNTILSMGFLPLESGEISGLLCGGDLAYNILISPQPTGGIRHVISHGQHFVATRLSPLSTKVDLKTGIEALEKETYSTLSLMRKIAPQSADNCVLTFIVSKAQKKILETHDFPVKKINVFTLEECCWKLGLESGLGKNPGIIHLMMNAHDMSPMNFLPKKFLLCKNLYQSKKILRALSFAGVIFGFVALLATEGMSWYLENKIFHAKQKSLHAQTIHRSQSNHLAKNASIEASLMKAANDQVEAMQQSDLVEFKTLLKKCLSEHITVKSLEWKQKETGETVCQLSFYFHNPEARDLSLSSFRDMKKNIKKVFSHAQIAIIKAPFGSSQKHVASTDDSLEAEIQLILPVNWMRGGV